MNFLQLCQRVRSESGVSGALSSVKNQAAMLDRIVGWVATEYANLQTQQDWRFLWRQEAPVLAAGQAVYTAEALGIPALGRILAQRVFRGSATGPRLGFMPYERLMRLPAASGAPRYFTRRPDEALQFYPVPDQAVGLSLEHLRAPHELVENTDQPLFAGDHLQLVIVWAALERYGRHAGDPDAVQAAMAGYADAHAALCERYAPSIDGTPTAMHQVNSSEPIYV